MAGKLMTMSLTLSMMLVFACKSQKADDKTETSTGPMTSDQPKTDTTAGGKPTTTDVSKTTTTTTTTTDVTKTTTLTKPEDAIALLASKKWSACSKATSDKHGYISTSFSFTTAGKRTTFQKVFKDAACATAFSAQELIDLGFQDSPLFTTGVSAEADYKIPKVSSSSEFNIDLTFDQSSSFLVVKIVAADALQFGSCTFDEALNGCGSSDAQRAKNFDPGVALTFKAQ